MAWWDIGDKMLRVGCDFCPPHPHTHPSPPPAGTGGVRGASLVLPDEDELPSSHQLLHEPRALGEEGQPGWFWVGWGS